MLGNTKIKWIASVLLAGILVTLGLSGGQWGSSFVMDASAHPIPIINILLPSVVPIGSPDKVVVVGGTITGTEDDTRVRFMANGSSYYIKPIYVSNYGASFIVTDTLMTEATVYTVTVIVSDKGTVPQDPLWPGIDFISNPLTFTVVPVDDFYLPIITLRP